MSNDLVRAVASDDRPPLTQPIIELRRSQQALSVLVSRLFEDLDVRRVQLDEQARQLRAERELLSQQPHEPTPGGNHQVGNPAAQIHKRLVQAEADLLAARSEIATYRERLCAALAAQGQPGDAGVATAQQLPHLEELESQRDELQRSLDAARTQISQLAAAALDLADARSQIATLREQLLEARAHSAAATGECDAQRQQQICELEYERRALRAELETVRRQAEELTESLAESRRQFVEERAEWSTELRHLRRLLERQSEFLEERGNFGPHAAADLRGSPNGEPNDSAPDPLPGAAVPRFAPLQHNGQERYGPAAANSPRDVNES